MALVPFRGFWDPLAEMNRLFEETFGALGRRSRSQNGETAEWVPSVDVLARDGDVVIRAELPGVRPEDVNVTLQENVLTISGERRVEQEERGAGYHVRERRYGSFGRSMVLPEGVDEDGIHARFDNGVLEVIVEGAAQVPEPRRIQIEGGSGERAEP